MRRPMPYPRPYRAKTEERPSHTIFVDSTSAIDRVRADSIGPGQAFAISAIESCGQIMTRGNEVTICWVPAHHGVPGNERADEFAKAAAEGTRPDSAVPDELRWGTSLSHMTRAAIEARTQRTSQWIAERLGDPRRKHRPPPGRDSGAGCSDGRPSISPAATISYCRATRR